MKGILLASHGPLAQGMLETTKLFFGEQRLMDAKCLNPEDNPDDFVNVLDEAIGQLDEGEGVIVFVDLLFGSPCNCMTRILKDNVEVITGMNLSMILELLGSRECTNPEVSYLCQTGKDGIANLKEVLSTVE